MPPNLLNTGTAWLGEQRHDHMTELVTYRRDDQTVELRATLGRSEHVQTDLEGPQQRVESRDYLIRVEDLTLGEPESGDEIVEADGSVYRVVSPIPTEPSWRHSDSFRRTYRVHTKAVEVATP